MEEFLCFVFLDRVLLGPQMYGPLASAYQVLGSCHPVYKHNEKPRLTQTSESWDVTGMVLRWKQWALNWTNMRTNPIYLHFYVHKVFLFFFFTCFDFLQNTASRWYLSWFMGFKHSFIFSPKVNECLVPCSHHLRLVPVPGVWVVQMSPLPSWHYRHPGGTAHHPHTLPGYLPRGRGTEMAQLGFAQ